MDLEGLDILFVGSSVCLHVLFRFSDGNPNVSIFFDRSRNGNDLHPTFFHVFRPSSF